MGNIDPGLRTSITGELTPAVSTPITMDPSSTSPASTPPPALVDWAVIASEVMNLLEEHDRLYEDCTCEDPPEEQPSQCWYRLTNVEQHQVRIAYVGRQLQEAYGPLRRLIDAPPDDLSLDW